jgi:hypothetical protein
MKAALLAALAGLVWCTGTVAAQDIVWNGANGVWNLASNWTPANVPNAAGEVAVLPVIAGPYTVDLNVSIGLDAVRFEDPASTFRLGGYAITILQAAGLSNAGMIWANGASTLSGNIFNHTGAQIVVEQNRTLSLAGPSVVNDGTIWVNHTGAYDAAIYFPTSVTVSGGGEIYINGDNEGDKLNGAAGVVVTQEAGHTIHGGGAVEVRLINHGTVQADKSSTALVLKSYAKTNDAMLRATGGATLRIYGITITNAGGILLADGGDVELTASANIVGGTLNRTGTSQIVGTGGATLTEVMIAPGARYTVNQQQTTTIAGSSLVNDGTILVNNTGGFDANLYFPVNVTVSGSGEIYMNGDNEGDRFYGQTGVVVTQAAGHTLHGGGAVEAGLINHGTVRADKSSAALVLKSCAKTNDGTFSATGGAILRCNGNTITNTGGTILADGGEVQLTGGVNIVGGMLDRTGTSQIVGTSTATLTDVAIAPGARYTVNNSTTTNIGGSSLVNDGTIWVNHTGGYDANIYFPDSVTVSGAGEIYINGDNDGDRLYGATGALVTQTAGHTLHGGGAIQLRFLNQGNVRADKPPINLVASAQGFDNQGIAEASGGAELRFSALPVNYASRKLTGGTWRVYENSRIRFNSAFIDTSAAAIVLHGPGSMIYANYQTTDALAGFVVNREQGSFTLEAGRAFTRNGQFCNSGSVTVLNSSAFTVGGANSYTQTGGVTRVDGQLSATAVDVTAGGLTGTGTVTGDVVSAGWVAPGASVGTLTLEGDYEQAIYGRLKVEIGGTGSGQSDLLLVNGQALLDGYLDVIALPGLTLEDGDSIRILTCAARQGEFAHWTGLCPLPGFCLDVAYCADGVFLVARELDPSAVEETPSVEPHPAVTELPSSIRLLAHQGPSSGSLLELDLPNPSTVCLEVFNVTGQREALLHQGQLAAGSHTFECGGRSGGRAAWGSGVYFARARVQRAGESVTKTVRLVILK